MKLTSTSQRIDTNRLQTHNAFRLHHSCCLVKFVFENNSNKLFPPRWFFTKFQFLSLIDMWCISNMYTNINIHCLLFIGDNFLYYFVSMLHLYLVIKLATIKWLLAIIVIVKFTMLDQFLGQLELNVINYIMLSSKYIISIRLIDCLLKIHDI